jgi:hypothetical protein
MPVFQRNLLLPSSGLPQKTITFILTGMITPDLSNIVVLCLLKPAETAVPGNGSLYTSVVRPGLSNCHMKSTTDMHATAEELLKVEFSMWSMPVLCIKRTSCQSIRVKYESKSRERVCRQTDS